MAGGNTAEAIDIMMGGLGSHDGASQLDE